MAGEFNIKNGFISNNDSIVNGKLGISVVTPLETLHVSGNTRVEGGLILKTLTGGTVINNLGVDSNGNVVVGTTSGSGTFTGGTVTGPTKFTNGLTANTISATTYYNLPISLPSDFFISTPVTGSSVTYLTDSYRTIDLQPFITGLILNQTNEIVRNNDDLFFIGNWDDTGTTSNVIVGLYDVKILNNILSWGRIDYGTLPIFRMHGSVMNRGFIYGVNRPLTTTTMATVIKINPYNFTDVKTLQLPAQLSYSGLCSDLIAYKDKLYLPFVVGAAGPGYMAMIDSDLNNYQSLFSFGNVSSGKRGRTQTVFQIYNDEFYIPTVNNASQPSAGNTIGISVYNMWGEIKREVSGIIISTGQTIQPFPHWMGIFNGKLILSQTGDIHKELLRFDINTLALEENITLPCMITDDNTIMSNGYIYLNGEISGATLTKVKYNDFTDITTEISNYNGGLGSYGSLNPITYKDTVYSNLPWVATGTSIYNNNSGNVFIGNTQNTTPFGAKLFVNGDIALTSSIRTSGSNAGYFFGDAATGMYADNGARIKFRSYATQGDIFEFIPIYPSYPFTGLTPANIIHQKYTIAPISGGTAIRMINLEPTINQTGSTPSIIHGIRIAPTLTSAFDFRAIEITGGKVIIPNGGSANEAVNLSQITGMTGTSISGGTFTNPNTKITLPSSTGSTGEIVYFGTGSGLSAGLIYYFNTSGQWTVANATTVSSSKYLIGIALGTSITDGMLIKGYAKYSVGNYSSVGTGDILYLGTTNGFFQTTAPSTSSQVVRIIGYCIDGFNDVIYFNPDNTWVELL